MKFIKNRGIEVLTNGSLNFISSNLFMREQIFLYKKDYKSLLYAKKNKSILKFDASENFYKNHYKF